MARGMFSRFKAEAMRDALENAITVGTDLKAYAFDAGTHTIDFDVDQFITDITAGALEGSAVTMTSVTVSDDGEVDVADFTFPSHSGATVEGILYTFTRAADELLVYYDDDANWTPDGNDVNITYTTHVFKL